MNQFREGFREFAKTAGRCAVVPLQLREGKDRDLLVIPVQRKKGFEVELECRDYGVYPSAGAWHSGCWDVTVWPVEKMILSLTEFVDSVLQDAVMEIRLSNGSPYKWTLHYQFDGKRISDTTGSFFYNWFGEKSQQILSNGHGKT